MPDDDDTEDAWCDKCGAELTSFGTCLNDHSAPERRIVCGVCKTETGDDVEIDVVPVAAGDERDEHDRAVAEMFATVTNGDVGQVAGHWICKRGHRLGTFYDCGQLDLGIVRQEGE